VDRVGGGITWLANSERRTTVEHASGGEAVMRASTGCADDVPFATYLVCAADFGCSQWEAGGEG